MKYNFFMYDVDEVQFLHLSANISLDIFEQFRQQNFNLFMSYNLIQ